MSRAYEDTMERRRDEYVASALGVSVETLDDYPFELDENASDDGVVYGWRVLWDEEAPASQSRGAKRVVSARLYVVADVR